MNHYRVPGTNDAACGNVCFGFGGELVDSMNAVSCDWCRAIEGSRESELLMEKYRAKNAERRKAKAPPMPEQVVVGGTYRHYKGDLYFVEDVALESTNGRSRDRVVVYRGTKGLNVRLESQFLEFLPEKNQRRFELVP